MSRAATTALLLGLLAACGEGPESPAQVMTVRRPALDLLELEGWRTPSGGRPEIGVITPSLSQGENSADQRALLVGELIRGLAGGRSTELTLELLARILRNAEAERVTRRLPRSFFAGG